MSEGIHSKTSNAPAEPNIPPAEETAQQDVETANLEAEVQELQREALDVSAEVNQLKDRLLRLQADFENYRKRVARDWAAMCARAHEEVITALLPILDHFELGLRSAQEHGVPDSHMQGFRLLYDQLCQVLTRFGLEPIDCERQRFNADEHEAVAHIPSAEVPAEHVVQQVRRGYRLAGRLLRPAQVVVSSGPPAPRDEEDVKPAS